MLRQPGSQFQVDDSFLERMADTMAHRGPDGAGTWVSPDGRIGLAHRRLSIIDLSEAAGQPMHHSSGALTIVYNGEIYNHAKLRKELEGIGHRRWSTDHSDTEVILNAFMEWGIDCIHRFKGMFAFAIWDSRSNELWLVRDRIGIKPLYYSLHNGRLTFASEIKALLADPQQPKAVDREALYHYLTFLVAPSPLTMFEGIRKLPAGHWLRVGDDGDMESRKYWDVLDHISPLHGASDAEIADLLVDELKESVQSRKVSDVPVGIFLSGGIDSTANALLFSQGEKEKIQTFCIGYSGNFKSYKNEVDFARKAADLANSRHEELLLTIDDVLGFLPQMVHYQDEPLADPVCVPLYYVSRLAREHGVTVCQVGEGSDELFLGYPAWKRQLKLQKMSDAFNPKVAQLILQGLLTLWPWQHGTRYEYLRRAANGQPVFWSGAGAFTEAEKKRLLGPSFNAGAPGLNSYDVVAVIHDRFMEAAWEPSDINWMTYMDLNLRLPELLLMRVDKMSMAASVEARVPFLDHGFVALSLSIPSEVKFRGGVHKYILKEALRDVVPQEIIDRPKQGFGLPLTDWFLDRLGFEAHAVVEQFCAESGLLNWDEAARVLARGETARIWTLWNLAAWWLHHFSRVPVTMEAGKI